MPQCQLLFKALCLAEGEFAMSDRKNREMKYIHWYQASLQRLQILPENSLMMTAGESCCIFNCLCRSSILAIGQIYISATSDYHMII